MSTPQPRSAAAYRWLLEFEPDSFDVIPKRLAPVLTADVLFALVLASPPVVKATGLSATTMVALVAAHACWILVSYALREVATRREAVFLSIALGNLSFGLGVACLIPVLAGDPRTPLWMLPVLYAAMNGSIQESAPSRFLLLAHTFGPLLTIPAFSREAHGTWAIAGPVLTAGASAATYHFIAVRMSHWRSLRLERDEAVARLRAREAELERSRLARDLHDSVGSSLGFLALHADLLERHASDPAQVRRLAALARESAREGLGDLRAVLEALAPSEATLAGVAGALEDLAARQLAGTGVAFSLAVESGADESLDPPVRLALVRMFQEALRNAVLHGGARHVEVRLRLEQSRLSFHLGDDGAGFDPSNVRAGARGLAGMRARALEAGGRFELESAPGAGTRVRAELPVAAGIREVA